MPEGSHSSIRYIEKVALNWYQMGIHTREEARDYTMQVFPGHIGGNEGLRDLRAEPGHGGDRIYEAVV